VFLTFLLLSEFYMKKISVIFALIMSACFAGAAVSATMSFNPGQTPLGSSITDNTGSTISAQFGFGDDQTITFTHDYNFTSSDASSIFFAQVNQLPADGINFTSILFDGVSMNFNALTNIWSGNGTSTLAHNIQLMGSQVIEGAQYSLTANASDGSPSAVPVPAAIWLFGSALAGLLGVTTRKTSGKVFSA
jgi:hypothetical protein